MIHVLSRGSLLEWRDILVLHKICVVSEVALDVSPSLSVIDRLDSSLDLQST
jgi:hypothetical protein